MNTKLMFTISKNAMKLIKAGKAVLSSGGVRDLSGRLIELAKPGTMASAVNPSFNMTLQTVNLISSLGSNVQNAFIQNSVNKANLQLDNVLGQLVSITKSLGALGNITALSWVNAAFSLANCCISVAGFKMTMDKLDALQENVQLFYNQYKVDQESNKIREYKELLSDLNYDYETLARLHEKEQVDLGQSPEMEHIRKNLSRAWTFLDTIINDFEQHNIRENVACNIIFTLMPVYTQVLNDYNCMYYYAYQRKYPNYLQQSAILEAFRKPEFNACLNHYLRYHEDMISLAPVLKINVKKILYESIQQQQNRLDACHEAVVENNLPYMDYVKVDERTNNCLFRALEAEDKEYYKGSSLENKLTERIKAGDVVPLGNDAIGVFLEDPTEA